ncbi:TetR family transcriptional regulator [Flavobacteriaceae bacterium R38]|nr:TetR family transcriptional regulator [Flavobacteriaceae bacterium R38]
MGYKYQKKDILQIGYDVFRKKGYHNVGINEILKQANIPKGSFYNFFKSKEDFAMQVIDDYGENNRSLITSFLNNQALSPFNRLKSFYQSLIDDNQKDNYLGSCLLNTLANELGTQNKLIATTTDKNFLSWVYLIAECVKEAQLLGEIRNDYSSFEIAEYLHAGCNGVYSRMKVTHSKAFMEKWLEMSFEFIKG